MTRRTVLAAGAAAPLAGVESAVAASAYWPQGHDWASVDPAAAGFDPAALKAGVKDALADNSVGVIVLRGGRIAAEAYAPGWDAAKSFQLASAAKSVVSVLVGIAIDQGFIKSVDQSAADFIPAWKDTPKAAITLRHMLTMTSGIGFEGLKLRGIEGDQFAINAAAPLAHPPGTHWAYDTATFHLLYHVVARAAGQRFEDYAQKVLIGPLGMQHWSWLTNTGHGKSGSVTNYYSADGSTRDLARFGLFALRGGAWEGRQLVSAAYMKAATSPSQDLNGSYGWLWWENAKTGFNASGAELGFRFGEAPKDTFGALGAGGQVAIATPSLDLVVVRQGQQPAKAETISDLITSVVQAIRGPATA